MSARPTTYYGGRAAGLKTVADNGMLSSLTPEERKYLLELRSALLHGLVMIERKLGIEPSVKTREEKRRE